ncbi:Histone acetyltransferase HPA2-like acetyltransferase [Shewanella piezotolerans WP3]|uniref:Histone acetyltransferase HPA2-like acetyltransferase n=1 Tax=Shewanella piezotolerans (strain WP3 / JCM 13877) TaxID=225849 RepID=B8CNW3_SHEPW|nr:GNAT family N-acetyltransferase [Shewanella piezotolerans]ACJ29082.1 Histone acetyltransferase HPA2-like acetyltransferase [Shewanella piezotolerans WP3]
MNIEKISVEQLDDLVPLFDQYMVFYKQDSAPTKYRDYLKERLSHGEATVFIAYIDNQPVGFVLNYHTFSSVALARVIVLNDLFISASHRKHGIANKLIENVIELAKVSHSVRIDLGTAIDNYTAQALYEKIGFVKDTEFFSYSLSVA